VPTFTDISEFRVRGFASPYKWQQHITCKSDPNRVKLATVLGYF